jgi:hypothetical protein
VLEAQAQFDGPERQVCVRVAEHDGRIYLELADEFWRCVEIGLHGWCIADDPPVRFRRPPGMLPLPIPVRGGSVDQLAPLLNLRDHDDFVLVVAWLLAALRSSGPFPLLVLSGQQGSAKTVLSKLLPALVDPNAAPVRALPRDDRELFIASNNGHVLAFDNLSNLSASLSDTLCRLASGGAYATRALYSNFDEILFTATRPIILNGIEGVISRPDLADRALMLTLDAISDTQRRSESARSVSLNSLGHGFWGPCWMRSFMACRISHMCAWNVCREWRILRSGRQLVKRRSRRPAPSKPLIGGIGAP